MKADRTIKVAASAGFLSLMVALVIIHNSPATAYEVSIYKATPEAVWGCLACSATCGFGIIVHQVYNGREDHRLWAMGLGLILVTDMTLISLPLLRNYTLWSMTGDPGTHLAWAESVIATGHIERQIFYPIAHIYLAQFALISGAAPDWLVNYLPLFPAVLSLVFPYFLAKSLLPQRGQVILAAAAGMTLTAGWYMNFTPNHLGNLLFPLLLYCMLGSLILRNLQWRILFLIMVFLIPTLHLVPAFALLLIMVTLFLTGKLLATINRNPTATADSAFQPNLIVTTLLVVWTITWISSFYIWESTIRNLRTLVTEGGPTQITLLRDQMEYAQSYGYSVAKQFFKRYASELIFAVLTVAALPSLLRKASSETNLRRVIALYGPLAVITLALIVLYPLNIGFGPGRLLIYIIILANIPVGFVLFQLIQRAACHGNWQAKAIPFLVTMLLLGIWTSNMIALYPSPYLLAPNPHDTQTELKGMDWLFHHRDWSLRLSGSSITPGRYAFILTPEEKKQRGYIRATLWEEDLAPYHFGYDKYLWLGQSYKQNKYLALTQRDRVYYTEMFPELVELRFLPEDFVRLENDPTLDKLYANSGFDVYYVHTSAPYSPTQ